LLLSESVLPVRPAPPVERRPVERVEDPKQNGKDDEKEEVCATVVVPAAATAASVDVPHARSDGGGGGEAVVVVGPVDEKDDIFMLHTPNFSLVLRIIAFSFHS
jgi:hypothetical protein